MTCPFEKIASRGIAGGFLSGWQLSGISRFTSGLPITMTASGDRSLVGTGGIDRPNYTGAPIVILDPRASSSHLYFDKSPFSQEALGVAGNANRRFFHGQGLNNIDVSLVKATKFGERFNTELRVEFFNVFNHAQFTNPVGNFTLELLDNYFGSGPRIGQLALKLHF